MSYVLRLSRCALVARFRTFDASKYRGLGGSKRVFWRFVMRQSPFIDKSYCYPLSNRLHMGHTLFYFVKSQYPA